MTDWLFLFYFLAAVWFPIEALTRRTIGGLDTVMASRSGELEECTQFQRHPLSLSRRASWLVVAIVVGFFALSGVRLIALTIANPPKRGERQLTKSEANAVLRRLQQPPLGVLASDAGDLQVFDDWRGPPRPQPGQCVVLVQKFDYDYYIPAGKYRPAADPRCQSLTRGAWSSCPSSILPLRVKFPHIFPDSRSFLSGRPQARKVRLDSGWRACKWTGWHSFPSIKHKQPDFARAVCAPPSVLLDVVRRP